ncbi:hypothetical protein D3C86_1775740 [compost metagenome]
MNRLLNRISRTPEVKQLRVRYCQILQHKLRLARAVPLINRQLGQYINEGSARQ